VLDAALTDGRPEASLRDAPTVDAGVTDTLAADRNLTDGFINSSTGVCAADGWCWDDPLPSGNGIEAMWGPTSNDLWAVGDFGLLAHWDGHTWQGQFERNDNGGYFAVSGSGDHAVWAVGEAGLVSHFNGTVWQDEPNFTSGAQLNGVYAVPSATTDVWAVGNEGIIAHRDASGWAIVTSRVATTENVEAVYGTASNDVWAVGSAGTVVHYDGTGWNPVSAPTGTARLNTVWASGPHDVYIGGNAGLLVHWDGSTWTTIVPSTGFNDNIQVVNGTSASDVWIGTDATLLHWDGRIWANGQFGSTQSFTALWDFGPNDMWTGAWWAGAYHYVGTSNYVAAGILGWPQAVFGSTWASSDSDVWVVGEQGLTFHYNGTSWTQETTGITNGLNSVWGRSPTDVWAVGDGGTLLRWTGCSWNPVNVGATAVNLSGVWPSPTSAKVWATGDSGTILYYDGTTWGTQMSPYAATIHNVQGLADNDLWAAGDAGSASAGAILHYDGSSWTTPVTGIGYVSSVWERTPTDVWAVGQGGMIKHWNGTVWSDRPLPGYTADIFDVGGTSGTDVWFCGPSGAVGHWTGTWSGNEQLNGFNLRRIFWDGQSLWMVGDGNNVLHN
jgi:hypothetical protein